MSYFNVTCMYLIFVILFAFLVILFFFHSGLIKAKAPSSHVAISQCISI